MGSSSQTSTMSSGRHFFVLLCSFIIIDDCWSLRWIQAVDGQLPDNAAKLYPNTNKAHYLCRVVLESGDITYGQLKDTSPSCTHPGTEGEEGTMAMSSGQFDVLVKDQETLGWKFGQFGSVESDNALKCDLSVGQGGDCYLGQGVYSDGICEEALGFIKPSTKKIYMTAYNEVATCPFYFFLTAEYPEIWISVKFILNYVIVKLCVSYIIK